MDLLRQIAGLQTAAVLLKSQAGALLKVEKRKSAF